MRAQPYRYRRGVASALDRDFRSGGAKPDLEAHREPIIETFGAGDHEVEVDLDLVRDVISHATDQQWDDHELDQWLAARLHYAVRVPRRVAGDSGFWTWMTIEAGQEYVIDRWLGKNPSDPETVTMHRYTGSLLRNALARLWWGAEMVRDGPSYEYVEAVFNRVWTAEYALELMYSWYRPAAIAFTKVGEGLDGHPGLTTSEMNDLSVRINSYLSLRSLERMGLQDAPDSDSDIEWYRRNPSLDEILDEGPLQGPDADHVEEEAVAELERWFAELADEAGSSEKAS